MYKLVIVDDEAAIRRGMCNYIPWNEMGFEVVADFEDGKETIEYVEENPIDVIITDIEMAEVSGLELSKYIYENQPSIKVIILSGYKLFEYAKKALEYRVKHYLLKPLKMDEVKEVFNKIAEELNKEQNHAYEKVSDNLHDAIFELHEQFFLSLLVGGNKDEAKIMKNAKFLELDLKQETPYGILDVKVLDAPNKQVSFFNHQDHKYKLLHDMFDSINDDIEYHIIDLSYEVMKVIAISKEVSNNEAFAEKLNQQIREKCQATNQLFELNVQVVVEYVFNNLKMFVDFKYPLQMKKKSLPNKELNKSDYKDVMLSYKLILKAINNSEFDELKKIMEKAFFKMRQVPLATFKQISVDMFSALSSKLMKMDSELWMKVLRRLDYQKFISCETKDQLKTLCCEYMDYTLNEIRHSQNETTKQVVLESMKYIRGNFGEEVSLELVADRYYLNSAYFSRVFKQYSGVTFTNYLIQVRMKAAIEYIETGKHKMYEISKLVGYNSEKYFYRVFKQYTGYSPAEYLRSKVLTHE